MFHLILKAVIRLQLCGEQKTCKSKSAFSKEAWKSLCFSRSHSRLHLWDPWRLMEGSCKLIIIFYPWTRMRVILLYHINYGVRQGFLILRKAVTTQGKNNVIF